MTCKLKIGIAGFGTVGNAVKCIMEKKHEILIYDKFKESGQIFDLLNTDIVFITVPTPFCEISKSIDLGAVNEIVKYLSDNQYSGLTIIKSTCIPGTSAKLANKFKDLSIVFNPEFLREVTAVEDFKNQDNIVFGVNKDLSQEELKRLETLYEGVVNNFNIQNVSIVSYESAELIKYAQNVMLGSRITTCNIIYDACEKLGASYEEVKKIAFYRGELIGDKVVEVPGHDGKRGFGGKCLPKDISAFNSTFDSKVLEEILKYNSKIRYKDENR